MKTAILLPYKENYSKAYAGAVSIFINGVNRFSRYKSSIKVYGSTNYLNFLSKNYVNISFEKKVFQSSTKLYLKNFINIEKKFKSDIIEIHNRPLYLKYFNKSNDKKFVIYFHNDPLTMAGSKTIFERMFILNFCSKVIFNSEWTKNRFFLGLDKFYSNSEKSEVIHQSTDKKLVDLKKKEKTIMFVGKLNKSKGYDLFGEAALKILKEFKDWKVNVYGDEPREKISFIHERILLKGYKSNEKVLKSYELCSIAVTCSRWNEPFGRSSLEASSRGCAVIISNKGGLPETITDGIILKELTSNEIYNQIRKLIKNQDYLKRIQKNSIKNFFLDNKYISNKIDNYRKRLFNKNIITANKNKLKILHITNFNDRHNGRLFYNTGRRINNGLLKLGHTVQTLSDRDIVSAQRGILDLSGSKGLNKKLLEIIANFIPDLIIFGHADQVENASLEKIKDFYPNVKLCQWFLDRMDDKNWLMNKKRFLKKISYLDMSFCTTHPSAINFTNQFKVLYMPNPVDESFDNLNIYKKKNYQHDLFFALSHGVHRGTLKIGKKDDREIFIQKLIKINEEAKFNLFGISNKQPIWAENFKDELSKSKMALNLSQGVPLKYYTSDRMAQLIGNGILTFIDVKTKLNKIFSNREVIFYNNIQDLSLKINKYKNNHVLRSLIAKNGMIKYHKYMNSKIIASFIIDKTLNINKMNKYFWEKK